MTATDELRRLLDERGVEWIGTSFSTPAKGNPTNTSLGEEHHEATFIEYDDGNVLRLFDLTPAQAVEATLGSDLEAENAKLRELAERAWKTAERLCQAFDGPCSSDGVTVYKPCPMGERYEECVYGQLQRELHELGVEV